MSQYVKEDRLVREAFYGKTTHRIGTCEGCRETKWSGWLVLYMFGHLFACVVSPSGDYVCAEEIRPDELSMYVDDLDAAIAALDAAMKPRALAEGEKP